MEQADAFRAAVFDWAGTTVDYGSRAPARVFIEIFARRGIAITETEARAPMGHAKHEHIALIAREPRVAELWRARYGSVPTPADVQSMYDEFLPLQSLVLAEGCEVIPGVPAAIAELRRRGLKIGSTTGYTRALMDYVIPAAAAGGYAPDVVVCVDEVTAGRPAPWMNFRAAELLGVYPMQAVLVVDDTPVGIEAGRQSGAFTLGVTQTGNALGLSEAEVRALPARELDRRLQDIEALFLAAGADAVIRSVADLPAWLSDQRPPANRVRSNR